MKTAIAYVLVAIVMCVIGLTFLVPVYGAVSDVFKAVHDAIPRTFVQRSHE